MANSKAITFKERGTDTAYGFHFGEIIAATQKALRPSAVPSEIHKHVRAKIMKMGFSYVGMRSLMQALYDLSNGEHWRGELDRSDTSEAKGYGLTKGTVKTAARVGTAVSSCWRTAAITFPRSTVAGH